MKNKIKHNKIKNSGILFECLIKQITADLILRENNHIATNLVKRIFNKNTELLKELQLYKAMFSDTKITNESNANIFIEYLLNEHKKLNQNKLEKEKFNAIKSIKEHYNLDDFFNIKIDNYQTYASLYKLFQYEHNVNESINPTDLFQSRVNLVNFLMKLNNIEPTQHDGNSEDNNLLEEFNKLSLNSKNLVFKLYVEKFNENYSHHFDKDQIQLVKAYIYNNAEFTINEFISRKIPILKSKISKLIEENNDILGTKLTEISKLLDKITLIKEIKTEHVTSLLKIYEIFKQLKRDK